MQRVDGSQPSRNAGVCAFINKGDWCEIQLEVVELGGAKELKFSGESLESTNNEKAEFKKAGAPAKGAECKVTTLIGGKDAKCYIKLEYSGPVNKPGKGKYQAKYEGKAQEDGGTNVDNDSVILEAEEV
jgi:hypothetical protein